MPSSGSIALKHASLAALACRVAESSPRCSRPAAATRAPRLFPGSLEPACAFGAGLRSAHCGVGGARSPGSRRCTWIAGASGCPQRSNIAGSAPLDDVARVQALAPEKRSLGPGIGRLLVLIEDGELVRGAEMPSSGSRRWVVVGHGSLMGARYQGCSRHGLGLSRLALVGSWATAGVSPQPDRQGSPQKSDVRGKSGRIDEENPTTVASSMGSFPQEMLPLQRQT